MDVVPTPAPAGLTARYEILGEVGRGGMGIVYKARDRETGELVALKVLKPEIAADQTAMERFKNELRLTRKITHKNVCRIHEFDRTQDTAYLSMEFVEGDSLRHILARSGGLRAGRAVQIASQICSGLREAHAQGVVHRDLASEPCGLAILRGTFVGLALLGADTFLVWLGTNRLGMRLDSIQHILFQAGLILGNPWPSATAVLWAVFHALLILARCLPRGNLGRGLHPARWRPARRCPAVSLEIPSLLARWPCLGLHL